MPEMKSVDLGTVHLFLKVVKAGKELIDGESGRKGYTMIDTFSMGASSHFDPKMTSPTGSINLTALSVARKVLPSTCELFKAIFEEANLDSVEMIATQKGGSTAGKDSQVVFTIKLEKARVTSCTIGGGNEGVLTESCTFEGVKTVVRHDLSKKEAEWNWDDTRK